MNPRHSICVRDIGEATRTDCERSFFQKWYLRVLQDLGVFVNVSEKILYMGRFVSPSELAKMGGDIAEIKSRIASAAASPVHTYLGQ